MKSFIGCLLFAALCGIMFSLSHAQLSQNAQKPNPEIEALKNRILVLESKLQTVENVEKMELAAKLADANARLANAEIDKFKRELKESNDEWLRTWSLWFAGISGFLVLIVGGAFWFWLRYRADQLIADSVEKSLNGFKEAVDQVNILKNELRVLQKEHAVSVLADTLHLSYSLEESIGSEQIKPIPDRALLDLLADKTRGLDFRCKAAEVLAARANPKLVSPVLELLNSIVDSKVNLDYSYQLQSSLRRLVNCLGILHTQETYEGLTKFLNRLLTGNIQLKDFFLTWTVFSLAHVSIKLDRGDSVSILRRSIPDLDISSSEVYVLRELVEYFNRFNEPEGIKNILNEFIKDKEGDIEDLESECLELLQKHDPDFVREWQAKKETTNTQNEESE